MRNTKSHKGQTLVDISMRETGVSENVFKLSFLNDVSITDSLAEGGGLVVDGVDNIRARQVFAEQNIEPVSLDHGSGIGFFKIGIDFIVE